MPLNSARSNCLDDKGKSDAAQADCHVRARCIVFRRLPESLFVLYCIVDTLGTNWRRRVLNSLRYRDVPGGIENDRNPRGELHAAHCPA